MEIFGFGKGKYGFGKKRDPKSGKMFDHEPLIADPENRDASGKVQPTASDMRRARKRGRDDAKRIFGTLEEGDPRMAAMMTLKPMYTVEEGGARMVIYKTFGTHKYFKTAI